MCNRAGKPPPMLMPFYCAKLVILFAQGSRTGNEGWDDVVVAVEFYSEHVTWRN